jgi:hypothetical protein
MKKKRPSEPKAASQRGIGRMKWTKFRELSPLERRRIRQVRSQGFKARNRNFHKAVKKLPHGDLEKYPEMRQVVEMVIGYAESRTPEQIKAWLDWRMDILGHPQGFQRLAPFHLFILGKEYPADIYGFFDDGGQFVPGLLPLLARKIGVEDLYTDPLDEIISEEDLSGKTVDEVVSMAFNRGMKSCNRDLVTKRVQNWDCKNPETSPKKSHTR